MIKQISHLGLAVKDLEKTMVFYRSVLRLDPAEPIVGGNERDLSVSLVKVGDATLELIQPIKETSVMAKYLEKRGEGIHHVCFEVDDIDAELEWMKSKGLEALGTPKPGAEGMSVFLHPKSTHGILIELVQKGKE
ncbi:MAG: VOC family protein [Dehalococcoidia bacterium]|nr:VOC family protein [Dehalococcoidia bacterium]